MKDRSEGEKVDGLGLLKSLSSERRPPDSPSRSISTLSAQDPMPQEHLLIALASFSSVDRRSRAGRR